MENGYNEKEREAEEKEIPKKKSRIWSVVALIFAILSVVLFFLPAASITLGVLAVAATVISRLYVGYFDNYAIAALIIAIFGIVFGGTYIIYELIIVNAVGL